MLFAEQDHDVDMCLTNSWARSWCRYVPDIRLMHTVTEVVDKFRLLL